MDWVIGHWATIFSLVSMVLVAGVWLYVRYWRNQELLWADLEKVIQDGVEYLKEWSKSQLRGIDEADVREFAGELYQRYVAGTYLAGLVGEQQFTDMVWTGFVAWRDRFVAMEALTAQWT